VAGEHFQWRDGDLLLYCHLQPGAKRSDFAGLHGARLKIRIKAAPVEGKANEDLLRFLADAFAVSRSAVSITQGQSSRQKTVLVRQPARLPAEALLDTPSE